jgi:hypothetical protein
MQGAHPIEQAGCVNMHFHAAFLTLQLPLTFQNAGLLSVSKKKVKTQKGSLFNFFQ